MPDTLFGYPLPVVVPVGVLPCDPDMGLKKTRKWTTKTVQFSPIIEQRFNTCPVPWIQFELSYEVLKGTFNLVGSKFKLLYDFFQAHEGRNTPFYFYDPALWGGADSPYREDPVQRFTSPGTGNNPANTVGRYVVFFDEDDMSIDHFEWRLRKTALKLTGYSG